MAIKLYYNKNTYQLITFDDGGESIVVGDDGGKEFHFYFGTGTSLIDYVNDVTIPVNYLGRAVIERPDGEVTNELYLTPQTGYYKLIVTDWISHVEGNLEITARLKVSDGDGGYIIYTFTVATIPVEAGVTPGDDTIEDAQYQALLDAVNAIPTGTTPFEKIILVDDVGSTTTVTYASKIADDAELDRLETDKADITYVDAQDTALQNQITSNDGDILILQQDVDDLEEANMVKSIVRTGTNLFTLTFYDGTTSNILTLAELKAFIGEATQSLSGLMSATDKTELDTLVALFDSDADDVVNTIAEILAIFEDYPEGVDLVTALAGKVDKSQIVNDLTTGGATDVLSAEQGKTLQTTTEKVANKATDFSTVNDTKYPSVQAVRNYVRDIGLDTPIAQLNNHSLREVFQDTSLFDSENLVTNGDFSDGTTGWTKENDTYTTFSINNNELTLTYITGNNTLYLRQNNIMVINDKYYINSNVKSNVNTRFGVSNLDDMSGERIDSYLSIDTSYKKYSYVWTSLSTNLTLGNRQPLNNGMTRNDYIVFDYIKLFNISTLIANKQKSPLYSTTFDLMSDAQIKAQMDQFVSKPYLFIDYEDLGISTLTVEQMDYWYGVYDAIKNGSTTYGFLNTLYDLFTSKANITQETWITPTLTTATTTYLKYRKDTLGTVIIEGNLTVTTAGTNFTLPTGYRPLFAYVQGDLTFNTNGTVVSASTGLKYINVRFTGGA